MKVAGNKIKHLHQYFVDELTPDLDLTEVNAQFALATEHFLGIKKSELNLKLNENINQSDLLNIYDCCKALKKQIPIQYVLGKAHFYDLEFNVNESVLIPRPETEELVDLILKEKPQGISVLDIGTGSGCIAIALKKNLKHAEVYACDISNDALMLAKQNADLNGVNIDFIQCNVLESNNSISNAGLKFDCIVSNPPYILSSEKHTMQNQVLLHEPHLALFVDGVDGILFYRKIIHLCESHLNSNAKLYFELNPITANEVYNLASQTNYFLQIELIKDMSGKTRFLKAIKK